MGFFSKLFGPNVEKLTEKGDIAGLIEILEAGQTTELRLAALQALAGQPGDQPIRAILDALQTNESEITTAAAAELRTLGSRAAPHLTEALEKESGDQALSILIDLGSDAIEPLRQALESASDDARRRALDGLLKLDNRLEDPEIREVSFRSHLAALGDRCAEHRVRAAEVLSEYKDPQACRALAAQLKDGDESVRSACSRALAAIGEPATPYLADALADRNANARLLGADLLGRVCSDTTDVDTLGLALRSLLEHCNDSDSSVKEAAQRSLHLLPAEPVIENRLELLADPERSDREELHEFIVELLEHGNIAPGRKTATLDRIQALGLSNFDQM